MLALYVRVAKWRRWTAYQQARLRLADELGLEPGPALKKLQMQILEQAPALQAPAPAPTPSGC